MTQDFRRILVPLDGSQLAEAVIPFAIGLASRTGGAITLLHVLERNAPEKVHGQQHLTRETDAHDYLESIALRCRQAGVMAGAHVHSVATGDVAASIAAHADELGAKLIAISTHGSGGMRKLLIGDIAQQILRQCTTSLLVVRPDPDGGAQPFSCRELMIAIEPATHGDVALPTAVSLTRACNAHLHLVTVIPRPAGLPMRRRAAALFAPGATRAVLELEREDAVAYLEEKRGELSRQGIDVSVEVRTGDPVIEIGGMLQRKNADLLVLATHGQAGLGALLAGSLAPRIMAKARFPLLLVRVTGQS